MKIIGQRELRNDNAVIIRGVESGEEYTVTRRGVPVARLVPITRGSDLATERLSQNSAAWLPVCWWVVRENWPWRVRIGR